MQRVSGGSEPQVLVFNKHGVGHMVRVDRFPRPGETIHAREWRFGEDGGKGTNVAAALGKQGIPAAFIGRVGADREGQLGKEWLEEAGVDTTHYFMSPEVKTDVGVVIIRDDGENMVIGSPVHPCYMTFAEVKKAVDDFPGAGYFVSGLEVDQEIPLHACRYAKERGLVTLLNASPLLKKPAEPMEYVDYLFVNELEGMELAGTEDHKNWRRTAEAVWQRCRPRVVVMTLGSRGCVLCERGECTFFPSYEVTCVDTVAAGDGFLAAFTAGLVWGLDHGQAADWGNRYAAVVVEREGAILSYPALEEARRLSANLKACCICEGV